ncbi:MAG: hypothetical protein F6J93_11235 [Oscillatoria sp. SIO1A7]|nr:hypothetical protein [Oscillatoria sp. SIO1A7]
MEFPKIARDPGKTLDKFGLGIAIAREKLIEKLSGYFREIDVGRVRLSQS